MSIGARLKGAALAVALPLCAAVGGTTEAQYQQEQADIAGRISPEPKDFILVAQPDGTLKANYCMWHVVNRRLQEKRMRGR